MKQKIQKAFAHPLISGSVVVFLGTNAANLFHFLFNFSMVRNLSAANYGDITGLISLITLATTPAASVIPTVINFTARFYAKNQLSDIKGLFLKLSKILFGIGITICFIFIAFSNYIGNFFNIHNPALITVTGIIVLIAYLSITNSSLLQAKLSFTFISLTNFVGAFLKFTLGIGLVFLGFGALGAMIAYTFAYLIPYLLSFLQMQFILNKEIKGNTFPLMKLVAYGAPAAIALYMLTSFTTTDILLVKHFFTPHDAGIYAVIALSGRIIFFLTAPIASVMFPLVIQKHEKNEKYTDIFLLALFFICIISVGVTAIYFLFPTIMLTIFNQSKNASLVIPYLGPYGIFMTLYSLLSVTTNFFLSIGKTKIYIPLVIGALAQVAIIWMVHATFFQVILISTAIVALLLCLFLLYYVNLHAKRK